MTSLKFSIVSAEPLKHFGICDASAAVPFGEDRFFVGNDEDNILRSYDSHQSGKVIESVNINEHFSPQDDEEIDIEGVTTLGDFSYWITSHGRSKKGKFKEKRHQFFAVQFFDNDAILEVTGRPYQKLVLPDILENPLFNQFNLKIAEKIAPKEGGLNIEGLTTTPEGDLLIGFRSPLPENKALLVPLKNPLALVTQTETKPQFGKPILLDLNGFGVRSIEYWSVIKTYIIIAGEVGGGDRFALYLWSGNPNENPKLIDLTLPTDFRPESVLFYPHLSDRFQILSDDGTIRRVDGQECKDIKDSENPEKYFRSIWVQVDSN